MFTYNNLIGLGFIFIRSIRITFKWNKVRVEFVFFVNFFNMDAHFFSMIYLKHFLYPLSYFGTVIKN